MSLVALWRSNETVTETYRREKVQVGAEPPKVPGPIRVIGSGERFSIAKVLRETYVIHGMDDCQWGQSFVRVSDILSDYSKVQVWHSVA
jgi:hypothetical protein